MAVDYWVIPPEQDAEFVCAMEDVLEVYQRNYDPKRLKIQRGIDFRVATQKPDGSWPMISRSTLDGSPGSAKL
jgi:hypothetical protein